MCFGDPEVMWFVLCHLPSKPTSAYSTNNRCYIKYTVSNGQLIYSFHSKATAWKTKLLYLYMSLTYTSKTSGKYSMVCFLVDAIVFSFPYQNPSFFALITTFSRQQYWWSTDNFGFDNSVDDCQAKYFHCSLHYVRATGFIKHRTLIVLCKQYKQHAKQNNIQIKTTYKTTHIVYTIQLNWASSYTCNCILLSWTCIIRPNTLQFHMAAMQGSSLFQPPL